MASQLLLLRLQPGQALAPIELPRRSRIRFARMEYVGDRSFNLAYFRHTDQWQTILTDLTLDECLKLIGDGGPFTLV